jgi:DNA replication factor GINS
MKELSSNDFDKVESIMLELFRMRRGKLVKIADSIKLNSELYSKLTVEENIFYQSIYDNSKEFERQITGDLNEQNSD